MPKGKPNEFEIDLKCFHAFNRDEKRSAIYVDKNCDAMRIPEFESLCDDGASSRFNGYTGFRVNVELTESAQRILKNDTSRNHTAEARINLKTKTAKIYCCNCDNFE